VRLTSQGTRGMNSAWGSCRPLSISISSLCLYLSLCGMNSAWGSCRPLSISISSLSVSIYLSVG